MEIIRRGTELYFSQNCNMLDGEAYGYILFRFVFALHLELLADISLSPFFWKQFSNLSPPTSLFWPASTACFVAVAGDNSCLHTAAIHNNNNPPRRSSWERPFMISPMRIISSPHHSYSASHLFPVLLPSLVSREKLRRSRTEAVNERLRWKARGSMRNGKDKLDFSLCPSIQHPFCPDLSSSVSHFPSISLPPSPSLWCRIVIPLGSIFQASEHPFTAAITNL